MNLPIIFNSSRPEELVKVLDNGLVEVTCPAMPCGQVTTDIQLNRYKRDPNDDFVGIVNGEVSRPQKWPFIVGLLVEGVQRCHGNIINENWVRDSISISLLCLACYYKKLIIFLDSNCTALCDRKESRGFNYCSWSIPKI